jgi:8-oxo-dGTP pyrophosphatase MutT (NUDIX family)
MPRGGDYHCDEAAARWMQEETGIPMFRWDVSDFEACRGGIPIDSGLKLRPRHPSGSPADE